MRFHREYLQSKSQKNLQEAVQLRKRRLRMQS